MSNIETFDTEMSDYKSNESNIIVNIDADVLAECTITIE